MPFEFQFSGKNGYKGLLTIDNHSLTFSFIMNGYMGVELAKKQRNILASRINSVFQLELPSPPSGEDSETSDSDDEVFSSYCLLSGEPIAYQTRRGFHIEYNFIRKVDHSIIEMVFKWFKFILSPEDFIEKSSIPTLKQACLEAIKEEKKIEPTLSSVKKTIIPDHTKVTRSIPIPKRKKEYKPQMTSPRLFAVQKVKSLPTLKEMALISQKEVKIKFS